MAQVLEFKLPDLGEGLTGAEIVRWLVEVGDVVTVDQPVVEVETAKAMVEVPCPYGGVVTARFGEEGTELPVGAPLLTVAVGSAAPSARPETSRPGSGSGAVEEAGEVAVIPLVLVYDRLDDHEAQPTEQCQGEHGDQKVFLA